MNPRRSCPPCSRTSRGSRRGAAPAVRVVAEAQHERSTAELGELSGHDAEVITAQRGEHDVELLIARLVDDRRLRVRRDVGEDIARLETVMRDIIGSRAV